MKRLEFGPVGTKPVLFLHGFPGIRSKQNRDIAENVAKLTNRHCIVLLYEGLGIVPGVFSFVDCMAAVEKVFLELASEGRLDLVGHSWGGFQAVRLASLYGDKIDRLVLMSPLLKFYPEEPTARWFADTARDNPQIDLGDLAVRAKEMISIGAKHPYLDMITKIPANVEVTLLQARVDQITPGEVSKSAASAFKGRVDYESWETDHSFLLNREKTAERIAAALK